MSQQIASLFGSLGFKVDTTGLDRFKKKMTEAKSELAGGARATNMLARKFRSLGNSVDSVSSKLSKLNARGAGSGATASYTSMANSVSKVDRALSQIVARQPTVTKAFGKIHATLVHGDKLWAKYRSSVAAVKAELSLANAKLTQLRANSTVNVRVNHIPTNVPQPNPINPRRSSYNGGGGMFGGGHSGGFGGGFFRSFLPATALAGGLTTAGYATKEVVDRGRDQQRMENILLFSAKNLDDFNDALKYVRGEALRLGLDSAELGRAFAQVNMSAGDKLSTDEKKKMFTDMSEFIMTTGAGKEDQKLIFKAINQMFSLGRIQAEELNQLTERGIPRAMIYDTAMEVFGVKSHSEVMKLQEKGKLDPAKLLPEVFSRFAEKAHSSGAFDKMAASSQTKQNQASETFNQLSQEIMNAGLDAALAKLFTSLTDLVNVFRDIVEGYKAVKKFLDEFTDGNTLLSIAVMFVLGILLKKRKALGLLLTSGQKFSKLMQFVTAFLNGRMGQAILFIIKRFGVLGAAITAITFLFKKVGEAMRGNESGEWTWLDTLIFYWNKLGLMIELATEKVKYFFKVRMETMANPWDSFTGDSFNIATATSKQVPLDGSRAPAKDAAKTLAEQKKITKELQKPRGFPYASPSFQIPKSTSFEKFGSSQPQVVKPDIKIYVDGVQRSDVRVVSSLMG